MRGKEKPVWPGLVRQTIRAMKVGQAQHGYRGDLRLGDVGLDPPADLDAVADRAAHVGQDRGQVAASLPVDGQGRRKKLEGLQRDPLDQPAEHRLRGVAEADPADEFFQLRKQRRPGTR